MTYLTDAEVDAALDVWCANLTPDWREAQCAIYWRKDMRRAIAAASRVRGRLRRCNKQMTLGRGIAIAGIWIGVGIAGFGSGVACRAIRGYSD